MQVELIHLSTGIASDGRILRGSATICFFTKTAVAGTEPEQCPFLTHSGQLYVCIRNTGGNYKTVCSGEPTGALTSHRKEASIPMTRTSAQRDSGQPSASHGAPRHLRGAQVQGSRRLFKKSGLGCVRGL